MIRLMNKETGKICTVISEYQHVTNDWNNDGDTYTLFGLWVEWKSGIRDFLEKSDIDKNYEKLS